MIVCLEQGANDLPADATATPSSVALLKSRMAEPFWCWFT